MSDRHSARAAHRTGPPTPGLAEWYADRQRLAERYTYRAPAGAVAERRVAKGLRTGATDPGLP